MATSRAGRRLRRVQKRASATLKLAIVACVLLVGAALLGLGWLVMIYGETHGPGRGKLVEVTLEPGVSVGAVAERLAAVGALSQPSLFELYARARLSGARRLLASNERRLRTGAVVLYDDMTPAQLLQRVAFGFGAASLRVTLPEGFSRFDIAQRLQRYGLCAADEFLTASEDRALLAELGITADSAEGYLFPDTYSLREGSDPRNIVRRLAERGRAQVEALLAEHRAEFDALHAQLGLSAHDVVTLASIVEKEAALDAERPIIAGVFLNRLRDPAFSPKRLQADPTVTYGCRAQPELPSCAGFDPAKQRITRAMLGDAENRYNTYRIDGLPPGPIGNPGLSSLRAVLSPAKHDYLYFVAKGGGRHAFSATLDAHNAAVQRHLSP